jgi:thiosulfate/3-mercaptopyruvate sulfurtransferase
MQRIAFFLVVLTSLAAVQGGLRADKQGYPRPELLIESMELAKPEVADQYVILDARPRAAYRAGHIPGAREVDSALWAKNFDHGQDAAFWGKEIGSLGIKGDSKVIVYDDSHSNHAARIWWILRYWGVEDVRLLNGGWHGWQAGHNPAQRATRIWVPGIYAAKAHPERLATKEQLLASFKDGGLQIIDARSEKEFCGLEKLSNRRAGAIPGAKHLEWIDLLDKQTQRFKSAAELRQLFAQSGIVLDKPAAAHCQSGGRAAVMAFALELMGAQHVSNYYPSWAEWGNADDTPVVPGKPREQK